MKKLSLTINGLSHDIIDVIVQSMNLKREKDWKAFAQHIWPNITHLTLEKYEQQGGMAKVIKEWGTQGGMTQTLFKVLNDLPRKDVLEELSGYV